MPTITNPQELADAIENAGSLILRWGHGQMRQLPAAEIEIIVAALRAPHSTELESELAKANARIDYLLSPDSSSPEAAASDTVPISRLLLLSMGTDHVIRGGPGPLFDAGWAKACEFWSKKLLDSCEPQGSQSK